MVYVMVRQVQCLHLCSSFPHKTTFRYVLTLSYFFTLLLNISLFIGDISNLKKSQFISSCLVPSHKLIIREICVLISWCQGLKLPVVPRKLLKCIVFFITVVILCDLPLLHLSSITRLHIIICLYG